MEISHPEGNSSQPTSFSANFIRSNCRTIFLSSHLISISSRRFLANSGDGDNLQEQFFLINVTFRSMRCSQTHLLSPSWVLPLLSMLSPSSSILSCSSLIFASSSFSFDLSQSTVRLSTVNWFGCSFPGVSSRRPSSNTNDTLLGGFLKHHIGFREKRIITAFSITPC